MRALKQLVLWLVRQLGYEICRLDARGGAAVAGSPVAASAAESRNGEGVAPPPAMVTNAALIDDARAHFRAACTLALPEHLDLGDRWRVYSQRVSDALDSLSTVQEAVEFAQRKIGFDHRAPASAEEYFAAQYEEKLKAEFPQFTDGIAGFAETALSRADSLWHWNGRLVSNVLFFHARYVLACLSRIAAPDVICEIGGGYGGPARLWLTNPIFRPRAYIIVDVPESLFFAEVFLKAHFGKDAVSYIGGGEEAPSLRAEGPQVILCPVQSIAALAGISLDLVVNTGSMQEMTEGWVDFYMDWLDRQPCRFLYSLNYFGQPTEFMAEGHNLWSPRLSPRWVHRAQAVNPPGVVLQTNRNLAEIVAERADDGPLDPDAALARAEPLLAERFFSLDGLMELMDLWRRSNSAVLGRRILAAGLTAPIYPKEFLYIARKLIQDGMGRDTILEGTRTLGAIYDVLAARRQEGAEAVIYD